MKPENIAAHLKSNFKKTKKSLEYFFRKYLRISLTKKVCKNCSFVFLLLFLLVTEQQTLLSFVDDDVTNPFEDDLESDMENGLFDPTVYEEEEEDHFNPDNDDPKVKAISENVNGVRSTIWVYSKLSPADNISER